MAKDGLGGKDLSFCQRINIFRKKVLVRSPKKCSCAMITGIIIFLLIVSNVLFSWKGFGNEVFFDRYKFNVDGILLYKQYNRLITSGFLHAGWVHLIFN